MEVADLVHELAVELEVAVYTYASPYLSSTASPSLISATHPTPSPHSKQIMKALGLASGTGLRVACFGLYSYYL